jgi:hypothetical protein
MEYLAEIVFESLLMGFGLAAGAALWDRLFNQTDAAPAAEAETEVEPPPKKKKKKKHRAGLHISAP